VANHDDLQLFSSAELTLPQQLQMEAISRDFENAPRDAQLQMFRTVLFDWQRKQNMLTHVFTQKLGIQHLPSFPILPPD